MIQQRGLQGILQVDSAGTASYHIGKLPDERMIEAARRRGYLLTSKAKAVTKAMIAERDMVIAMDRENYADILRIVGEQQGNVKMLSDFLDESWPLDVPDPYYGGEAGFEYVLDMLEASGPKILGVPEILGD
jgi:protein-tyrosine phosphatase